MAQKVEQHAGPSLSLVLTDAVLGVPTPALRVAPGYELGTEAGAPLDVLVSDRDVEAGARIPRAQPSYLVLEVMVPAEEFGAGVVIVQPHRAASEARK
jgi:hypothetical protein